MRTRNHRKSRDCQPRLADDTWPGRLIFLDFLDLEGLRDPVQSEGIDASEFSPVNLMSGVDSHVEDIRRNRRPNHRQAPYVVQVSVEPYSPRIIQQGQ